MGEVAHDQNNNFGEFHHSECVNGNINAEHNVTAEIRERELVETGGKAEIGNRVGTEALDAEIQVAGFS
jgi:hypothetical protein